MIDSSKVECDLCVKCLESSELNDAFTCTKHKHQIHQK